MKFFSLANNYSLARIDTKKEKINKQLSKGIIINVISEIDELAMLFNQMKVDESKVSNSGINQIKNNYLKYYNTKNWYGRPSSPDMLFEESISEGVNYDGSSIHVWNIDGFTEYQILNLLQEVDMAVNAFLTNNNTNHDCLAYLINEFTGQLRGWWFNYLTEENRNEIRNSTQVIVLDALRP